MELDASDNIVWSFENDLQEPSYALKTKENNTIISDRAGNCIKEISPNSEQIWSFESLNKPEQVKKLDNGNYLVAEAARVIEVTPEKKIIWEFMGKPKVGLRMLFSQPSQVYRLENGNTLIIHTNERKALELDNDNNVIWQNLGSNFTQAN
jgi:hypothetical protein